jgi:transcriptional regulator with XRE-family HTH domain
MDAKQCRMARSGLNISGRELADLSGVGYATIARFEAGANITDENREKLKAALIAAGAQFTWRSGRAGVTVPE